MFFAGAGVFSPGVGGEKPGVCTALFLSLDFFKKVFDNELMKLVIQNTHSSCFIRPKTSAVASSFIC